MDVPWVVLSVGADGQSLLVQYYFGGSIGGEPRISTDESDTAIEIRVEMTDATDTEGEDAASPAVARAGRSEVRVRKPVAGRRITGDKALADGKLHAAAYRTVVRGTLHLWVVPRVIGLHVSDAEWVLRAQGFEPQVSVQPRLRDAQVIDQEPSPDSLAQYQQGPIHGTVRLSAQRLGR